MTLRLALGLTSCLCVWVAGAPCAAAQSPARPASVRADPVVAGTLIDALSGSPVEGAMVVLLDAAGEVAGRSMTGGDGAFALETRLGGRFTVRADRIGHESTVSDTIELHAGDTVSISLEADVRAIELEALDVEADPRCVFRPEEGRAVAQLWAEARKSLETARWSGRHGLYEYEFVEFERLWDRSHSRLQEQRLKRRVQTGQAMFGSVPIDALVTEGFVVVEGSDRVYRGPDAEVMLSDPFLDTHCFRIGRRTDAEDRIALEFQPVADVDRTEIDGTLWLDRYSGELLSIEYRYRNAHQRWGEERFGGRIEFDRLPTGPSIVRRWAIWMPSLNRDFGQRRDRLVGILEQGAEVLEVRAPLGATIRGYDAGRVAGVVTRGREQRPAPGVIVALEELDAWAESDSLGAFEIFPVIAGPYTIRVSDMALAKVGRRLPGVPIRVEYDSTTTRNLHLEDPNAVLFEYCGNRRDFTSTTVLIGRVRSTDGTELVEEATVRVRWLDPGGRSRSRDTESNSDGFYVICGVPRGQPVSVSAEQDRAQASPVVLPVPPDSTELLVDLILAPPPPS